ncbi:MAG: dTMP kinase [Waddliaceae bacterium]
MLITFEGGEGSGKSTLIEKLYRELTERGHQVVKTREPGGTGLGEFIRDIIINPHSLIQFGDSAELMMMLAARVQHIEEVIQPALSVGKIVLCDRFNDSSVAYQGGGRQLGIEKVQALCGQVCGQPTPTITFFLDIDPATSMERIVRLKDRFEDEDLAFHQRVRQAYHDLAREHPQRFFLIDAAQTEDEVFSEALAVVNLFSPPKEAQ